MTIPVWRLLQNDWFYDFEIRRFPFECCHLISNILSQVYFSGRIVFEQNFVKNFIWASAWIIVLSCSRNMPDTYGYNIYYRRICLWQIWKLESCAELCSNPCHLFWCIKTSGSNRFNSIQHGCQSGSEIKFFKRRATEWQRSQQKSECSPVPGRLATDWQSLGIGSKGSGDYWEWTEGWSIKGTIFILDVSQYISYKLFMWYHLWIPFYRGLIYSQRSTVLCSINFKNLYYRRVFLKIIFFYLLHQPVFVIVTGKQTTNQDASTSLAEASRRLQIQGSAVFVLGIGKDVDPRELSEIASGQKNVFIVNSYKDLEKKVHELKRGICVLGISQSQK